MKTPHQLELDQIVLDQLNLQVKISYHDHHEFLLTHGLNECHRVLDVGTGNGSFVAQLSQDHADLKLTGIDKRKYCIDHCQKMVAPNLEFYQVDMFDQKSTFDFSKFDGFLMRYSLLHADHSHKILELFKARAKRPSKFWIIDLDFSQIHCEPQSAAFEKMLKLIKEFCAKKSVDSLGGQRILPMLEASGFQKIKFQNHPFSTRTIQRQDLALYLKQEVLCYSIMIGRSLNDPETMEIVNFIEQDFESGKVEISYGMILISAELN